MATQSLEDGEATGAVRRASGRVRKQPQHYASSPVSSSGKRKRNNEDDANEGMLEDESDSSSPSEDDEPDPEEIRERNRRARQARPAGAQKPAQKKARTNGATLPIRSAKGGNKSRATKKARAVNQKDAEETGGLYAAVFAGDESLEHIAADWLRAFREHESAGLAILVNFVLKSAGCDIKVSDHDIEDVDGVTNRLTDIQDEFQASSPTDYPLIAKGKAATTFKQTITGFLSALVKSIAADGLLYTDAALIENIQIWFSTMSSAGNRAFRHTATVCSLAIVSALCGLAAQNAKEVATDQRQIDAERKKSRVNKGRVKQLEEKMQEHLQVQEFLDIQMKDWFDTVFIHRYRDVNPAIRRDCASALGDWIMTFPDLFLDGQHLRYLGWVLNDKEAHTRGEVLRQLQRLYKDQDKASGLKTFTDRFRARMVEMAQMDAETSVRVLAVELLDLLRSGGLLEPDDVDNIGKLIYDSDPRVRKVVAGFFAENVDDLYNSKIDELGGLEALEETLPEVSDGTFDSPGVVWLKLKALAETMVAYDEDDHLPNGMQRNRGDGSLSLRAAGTESRFTLAAAVLYDKIDEVQEWQGICGYLLYDHSSDQTNGVARDSLSQLKHECVLTEREEIVLLEVASSSVKRATIDLGEQQSVHKAKLTKRQKENLGEEQEEAARQLADLIPALLKKFGDNPTTAAAVLRMEKVLSLPSLKDVISDSLTYGALLDDVRKQFLSHGTDEVLGPASEAILHAKSYGELDDVTEEKLAGLWEDVLDNLTELLEPATISVRGSLQSEGLSAVNNNLLRIIRLAQVFDPISHLENPSILQKRNLSSTDYSGVIDYLIALVQRGVPSTNPALALSTADASLEDSLTVRAAEAGLRYLQWKLTTVITTATASPTSDVPFSVLEALATRRDAYVNNLHAVLHSRRGREPPCAALAAFMLDLHSSSVVLKNIKIQPGVREPDWTALIENVGAVYFTSILKVFAALEKTFADLSGKKLESAPQSGEDEDEDEDAVHADPMDEEPLSDSEDEDGAGPDGDGEEASRTLFRNETRQRKAILAEQELCQLTRALVYAVHAGVVDETKTRKRLERNKGRLGHNFKEMLAYLDLGKAAAGLKKGKGTGKNAVVAAKKASAAGAKGKRDPKSNAIIADEEVEDEIEDEEEEMRRRELVVEEDEAEGDDGVGEVAGEEVESVLGD